MSIFKVLICSAPLAEAFRLAQLVPQPDISRRTTYNGGWALGLAGSSCPSDAPVACDTGYGSINPMCCPSGQTCSGDIRPYCCPSATDCVNVVQNVPVCANSSWNMYAQGGGNYFCCEPNQFGVLPLHGYAGICEPLDQSVASSLIATPASQVGGVAVTTVGSQTGGGGANTQTVTSTLQNGALTTITTAVSGTGTAVQTQTAAATGTEASSSGGGTASITVTKGAEIGIAVAAGIVLLVAAILIWRCLRSRKRKQQKLANNEGYAFPTQGQGPAPMYSAVPQQMGNIQQQQQPYVVSPVQEYKTPVVGVMPQYGHGSPTPPPPSVSPFGPPNGSPPPVWNQQHHQQQQGGYGSPSPQMQGRFEVPGGAVTAPVEAPNSWERGLDHAR